MAAIQYEFVDEADDSLICCICQEVARDPLQEGNCGKLFCSKCISKVEDHKCPYCRSNKPKYFEDKRSHREIQDLKVKCTNTENGCEWIGPLGTASDHVTESCDFTLITCKYKDIGCKERHPRKRMREHEDDTSFHFSLSMYAVKKLTQDTLSTNGITIKMNNYSATKESKQWFISTPFYSHPNGYKACLCVWPTGENSYMNVGIQLLTGPYDASLSWPFEGSISIRMLNQIQDKDHCRIKLDVDNDNNWKPPDMLETQFNPLKLIKSLNTQYLKDDTLYFNIKMKSKDHRPWLNTSFGHK